MAFTVDDFTGLLQLLEQHPEWRAQLRRHVLADELLELPAIVRELAEAQKETQHQLERLAAAQERTEKHLEGVISRVGRVEGELLEIRYARRAGAYFGPFARRVRVVDSTRLADMLDDAVEGGRVTPAERRSALLADLVFSGRRREDDAEAHFVVEISVGIGMDDVQRARDRASIVEKLGRPAVAIVAGDFIDHHAAAAAEAHGVRTVLDGQVN